MTSISSKAAAFWDAVRTAPKQIDLPLTQRREAGEHAEDPTSTPPNIRTMIAPDALGLWVEPTDVPITCDMLYLFGGGYVLGSPASRQKTAGHLARACGARVLVANYRLAPEHPFPAAIDDVMIAYRALAGGPAARPLFVVGDSAGGGLAVVLGLAIRDAGLRIPAGIIALSPWADLTCSGSTMQTRAQRDIECSRAGLMEMAGLYLGGADPETPYASPVFGDFRDIPPLLCLVGSEEILLDDTMRLVHAAADAGGSATAIIAAGMQHVYPIWAGVFPEADHAIRSIGVWVREAVGTANP